MNILTYDAMRLFAACLLLSLPLVGCDSSNFTGDPEASLLGVESPGIAEFGEHDVVEVTISNPTDEPLYLGKPDVILYRETSAGLVVALDRIVNSALGPPQMIEPGSEITRFLGLSLSQDGLEFWDEEGPVDGTYRVRATLYTTPGKASSGYVGKEVPEAVSFSEPFELTFVESQAGLAVADPQE